MTRKSIMAVLSKRRAPKRLAQMQRTRAVAILNQLAAERVIALADQLHQFAPERKPLGVMVRGPGALPTHARPKYHRCGDAASK